MKIFRRFASQNDTSAEKLQFVFVMQTAVGRPGFYFTERMFRKCKDGV
jgi:hypothetical protein